MFEWLSQIIVIICFIGMFIVLFYEKTDYITYAILFMVIAVVTTAITYSNETSFEKIILAINWRVIIFLICIFVIVEILNEKNFFAEIANPLVMRFQKKVR